MKPKERKYNFVKALCDTYGYNTIISRKQIHEVYEKSPEIFTHPLPMEKELRWGRGEYKTPKNLTKYDGFAVPTTKSVKDVLHILSSDDSKDNLDLGDTSYYNDYVNEQDDIDDILRMM